jgi:hypothetical protein
VRSALTSGSYQPRELWDSWLFSCHFREEGLPDRYHRHTHIHLNHFKSLPSEGGPSLFHEVLMPLQTFLSGQTAWLVDVWLGPKLFGGRCGFAEMELPELWSFSWRKWWYIDTVEPLDKNRIRTFEGTLAFLSQWRIHFEVLRVRAPSSSYM